MGKDYNSNDPIDAEFKVVEPEEQGQSDNHGMPPVEDPCDETGDAASEAKENTWKEPGKTGPGDPGNMKKQKKPKKPNRPGQSGGAGGNAGKKAVRAASRGTVLALVLIAGISLVQKSMYSIGETESVVITTFGKASVVEEKGLHFKIPFIQKATRVDTTVKGVKIGYSEGADGNPVTIEHESIMITSDYNFIDCDFYVSYQVTDPVKYLYQSDEPDIIVKNIAMSCIRSTLSAYSVDTAITTGKAEIQSNVKSMIIAELEEKDIGITLIDASIQDVEPPTDEIIEAFTAVETAKQGKESSINQANAYRNEQIPAAEAEADRIKQEAEAKKTSRINEARGQAARFEEEYSEYKNYPLITKQRMFMETMEDVLPTLKVVIDNGNGSINKYYPITDLGSMSAEEAAVASEADGQ
ncbi:MAG: FtsH protease activity modulator HflK [Lachnospiraceae bacterium]|nr:FtsH protease activity modulator HflK [Lachnospiraceae bacterium]